jgi:hypothetical protein
MKKIKSRVFFVTFVIALIAAFSIPAENIYAQQFNKIFEVPGGGGGGSTTSVDNNDNSALYVVGGLVIVGIVIYAVLKNKKAKEKATQDSTKASIEINSLKDHFANYQNQVDSSPSIPVNLFIGSQRDLIRKDEKRYYVGLSYNF